MMRSIRLRVDKENMIEKLRVEDYDVRDVIDRE